MSMMLPEQKKQNKAKETTSQMNSLAQSIGEYFLDEQREKGKSIYLNNGVRESKLIERLNKTRQASQRGRNAKSQTQDVPSLRKINKMAVAENSQVTIEDQSQEDTNESVRLKKPVTRNMKQFVQSKTELVTPDNEQEFMTGEKGAKLFPAFLAGIYCDSLQDGEHSCEADVLSDEQFLLLTKIFDDFYKFHPLKKVVSTRITARHS